MTVKERIEKRISVRTYSSDDASRAALNLIRDFGKEHTGPLGSTVKLAVVDMTGHELSDLRKLGTYGIIKGAKIYATGTVKAGPDSCTDFGYIMEKLILEATARGLGSCWLGGFFSRSGFAQEIMPGENEVIPAATPLGFPLEKASFRDNLIRFVARSDSRKPWEKLFFSGNSHTPLKREEAVLYTTVLEGVRLAPSASNKQPWRIVKSGHSFHFYMDEEKLYNHAFQGIEIQRLDMGIAMAHFELAAIELNLNGQWKFEDPGLGADGWVYIASWAE